MPLSAPAGPLFALLAGTMPRLEAGHAEPLLLQYCPLCLWSWSFLAVFAVVAFGVAVDAEALRWVSWLSKLPSLLILPSAFETAAVEIIVVAAFCG